MALAYLKLHEIQNAYQAASKAVEVDPSSAAAHSALGAVYFRQGQLYQAQTEFLLPFKLGQKDARAYLGLEKLYLASYNFKRAKVAIDQAHSLAPNDPEIASAWLNTRPLPERVRAMQALINSSTHFYSRAEIDNVRHSLAVLNDRLGHPERTCKLANRLENSQIPMVPVGDSSPFMGLKVYVNGQKTNLVISTSQGDGIVIDKKIADKARIQKIVTTDMGSLGEQNPPEAYVGYAQSIKVGNLQFENCYLTVVEQASHGSFFDREPGTIDTSFFPDYLVDLDMPHATLKLEPLPKLPSLESRDDAQMDAGDPDAVKFPDRYVDSIMTTWVQMYRFGSAIAIPAAVNASPPELFNVDTASYQNSVELKFAQKWASPGPSSSPIYSTDGKVDTLSSGRVSLQFAGMYFDSVAEPSFSMKAVNNKIGTELYGTLGFEVLHNLRTTIDYRDGLIHFDYSLH